MLDTEKKITLSQMKLAHLERILFEHKGCLSYYLVKTRPENCPVRVLQNI